MNNSEAEYIARREKEDRERPMSAEEYALTLPEKERARFLKMTKQIGKQLGDISDKINEQ